MSPPEASTEPRFERYVALGDSSTEGLDDPDGHGGYRGWADRLAEQIASRQGSLLYANLAIRGRRTRQIRDQQLAQAAAMRPDLASLFTGTNDVVARHFDPTAVAEDLLVIQRTLILGGATLLTFTLPDLGPVLPLAKRLAPRIAVLNTIVHEVSRRTGALCVDFAAYPVSVDPRLWSDDRLHANSLGHARIAAALAHALGLPEVDASWQEPLPTHPTPTLGSKITTEIRWTRRHLIPWLWRHARGRSLGDDRQPKRPELQSLYRP